jgi:hypothetical protein
MTVRVLVALAAGTFLSACTLHHGFPTQLIANAKFSDPEKQLEAYKDLATWDETLGRLALFIDKQELRGLIVDQETFLIYGLGTQLVLNPGMTYEMFQEHVGGPVGEKITREDYNSYRYRAYIWIEEVKARPHNRVLLERLELFTARAKVDVTKLPVASLLKLLNDDQKLAIFLTDDVRAKQILGDLLEDAVDWNVVRHGYGGKLGPVYTGVTPGTAS